mgnify:CR=1 FL=1
MDSSLKGSPSRFFLKDFEYVNWGAAICGPTGFAAIGLSEELNLNPSGLGMNGVFSAVLDSNLFNWCSISGWILYSIWEIVVGASIYKI